MMWYWGGGFHWWGWLFGGLALVAFWVLVVWAIWAIWAGARRPSEDRQPPDSRRILDERLARGEIEPEEYWRLRDILEGRREHAGAGSAPGPGGTGRAADTR